MASLRVCAVVSVLLAPVVGYAQEKDANFATVRVTTKAGKETTLKFDLTLPAEKLNVAVRTKMADAAPCPEKRKRIAPDTWVCGDGTIIKTSSSTLQKVIAGIFE